MGSPAKTGFLLVCVVAAGIGAYLFLSDRQPPPAVRPSVEDTADLKRIDLNSEPSVTVPIAGEIHSIPLTRSSFEPKRSPAAANVPQPRPTAPSDVAVQLRLFDEAEQAGRAGDHDRALELLAQLEQRFPSTELKSEIELSKVEQSVRAGRQREALVLLQAMLKDPANRDKRARLHSLAGDLWRQSDDCPRARKAYGAALAAGLPAGEAAAVRRARDACRAR